MRRFAEKLLGVFTLALAVCLLGANVAFTVVWLERPEELLAVGALAAVTGLLFALGALAYYGLIKAAGGSLWVACALTSGATTVVMVWVAGLAQHQLKGWPVWPFHLGAVAAVAGLVALAVRFQVNWSQQVSRAMAGFKTTSAAVVRPGDVARIEGTIGEVGLTAPASGHPCAAWAVEIQGLVSRHGWVILGPVRSRAAFVLLADGKALRVEAGSTLFEGPAEQDLFGFEQLPPELLAAVSDHPFLARCQQFSVRELRVRQGARVSVLGMVRADGVLVERAGESFLLLLGAG